MDDEAAAIRRRIAEARAVQERLAQMQARIRLEHDRLENVIRGFSEDDCPRADELSERLPRGSRRGPSHR